MKTKNILAFFIILAAAVFLPAISHSKVYIDLQAPAIRRLPLAIQGFKYSGPDSDNPGEAVLIARLKTELYATLARDLDFSGLFTIIDKSAFLEDTERFGMTKAETDFSEWRMIGADALIKASFDLQGDRLVVESRFFDAITEEQVFGKRYIGSVEAPERLAHYFADQLYEVLTGRPGIFSTRIMFVSDRTGTKEIYLSDYDGANIRRITANGSINLSPQWSPDGREAFYTSYKGGTPATYRLNLVTGRESVVSNQKGVNIGMRPAPDGERAAITLSTTGTPQIYLLDLENRTSKRLTRSWGIDVSPTWSPDGEKLAFVSDRAGNPHIFMVELRTGKTKRITFNGIYNASPAWSPDGRFIAFSRSESGPFNIWVMDPEGDNLRQLTYTGNNKNPSWSPDGRFIVFSSTRNNISSLYMMRSDGSGMVRLDIGAGNETTPVWSPFLD